VDFLPLSSTVIQDEDLTCAYRELHLVFETLKELSPQCFPVAMLEHLTLPAIFTTLPSP